MQQIQRFALIFGVWAALSQLQAQEKPRLPSELLNPLLTAEFALRRNDLGLAFSLYAEMARNSHDPALAKRATKLALAMGKTKDALVFVEMWADADTKNPEAQLISSVLFTLNKKFSKAAHYLKQLITQKPSSLDPFLQYYQQFESSQKALARLVIEQLSKDLPENQLLSILLSDFAYSDGDLKTAHTLLSPVLKAKNHPTEADILYIHLLREEEKPEKALRFLENTLKKHPHNIVLRREYFELLLEQEQTALAFKQLQHLLQEKVIDPDTLIEIGRQAMEMAWYTEATLAFERVSTSSEHSDISYYFLGRTAELQKKWLDAVHFFKQVTDGPFQTIAHIRGALLLNYLKEYDQALLLLNNTTPYDEIEQKQLYLTASEVLFNAKRFQDGIGLMNEALTLFSKDIDFLYAHSLHAEALKDIPLAEKDLLSIIQSEPNHVDALNALGFLLTNHSHRYTEAYTYLEKAHDLDPENPIVMDSIGWWYFRKGEINESVKWLKAAFERYADGEIAAHLGEALWHQGERSHALEIWRLGLSQAPQHPTLLETMGRLQKKEN